MLHSTWQTLYIQSDRNTSVCIFITVLSSQKTPNCLFNPSWLLQTHANYVLCYISHFSDFNTDKNRFQSWSLFHVLSHVLYNLFFSGDIGGQMGLFIGASILTVLELFDYLYEVKYLFSQHLPPSPGASHLKKTSIAMYCLCKCVPPLWCFK